MVAPGDLLRGFFRLPVADPAARRKLASLERLLDEALAEARQQGCDRLAADLPELLTPYLDELSACSHLVLARKDHPTDGVAAERLAQAVEALRQVVAALPERVAAGWPAPPSPVAAGDASPSPLDELRASAARHLVD